MSERLTMRGVLLAAALAVSAAAAQAQEAAPLLKPTVLDDTSAITSSDVVPQSTSAAVVAPEELIAPRKKEVLADPYAPTGINTGGIKLYPTIEIGGVATSNVAQSNTKPKADIGLHLKPGLRFESDWSRHSWTGSASADFLHYVNDPNLSTLTGATETKFRLDILHTTHADFTANFVANETGLGDSSLPTTAAEPRRDKNIGVGVDLVHDFGGLEGSVKAALARSVFDDVALTGGGTEVNSDRNYIEPSLTLRATLGDFGARLKPYTEVGYAPRFHDQAADRNGQKRDSQGFSGTIGVNLDDGPIWQGDIALAYLLRSYADPALVNDSAFGLKGRLAWSPTPLLKIEGVSGIDLGETENIGIGGTKSWNAGINVSYAIRDNVNLLAGVGFTRSDTGTATTMTKTATAGFEWALNPNMSAAVTYLGTWYDDGTALGTGNYNDQRVSTSLVLKK